MSRASVKRPDYLAVVEAAYASCAEDADWLQGIAEAALPILDQGRGVHVWSYDARAPAAERMRGWGQAGCHPDMESGARRFVAALPAEIVPIFFPARPPVESLRWVLAHVPPSPEMINAMAGAGVGDALALRGHSPDGKGLNLSATTAGPAKVPARAKWALTRIALHLAAAARLRFDAPVESRLDNADAIFTPRGRLEHLAEPKKDPSTARVLPNAVERRLAANAVRADPNRALELWRALIAGRWSIVDHLDRDGKRFILAKSNTPGVHEPAALTSTERLVLVYASWGHSNKVIAYETGFSPAAVSMYLHQALRKLRLRSRADLEQVFGSSGPKR